ncbi:MAG: c-type cytochrome, partial [Candidatus Dormibacteria bacterium]
MKALLLAEVNVVSAGSDAKGKRLPMTSNRFRQSLELQSLRPLSLIVVFIPALLLCQNSQPPPSTLIQDGKTVYVNNCSGCHGSNTEGTDHGPRLTGNTHLRSRSVDELSSLIESGFPASGMPPFHLPRHDLEAVAAFVHSLNSSVSETVVSGDASAGSQFFWENGNCGSCHMVHGTGSPTGPDLSNIGSRMTVEEISDLLMRPDQHITPGYDLIQAKLRNGQTLRGFARGRTNFDLQLQDLDGSFHLLQSGDVLTITDEKHSLMKSLDANPDEIRNLSAYLSGLSGISMGPLEGPLVQNSSEVPSVEFSRIQDPRPGDWLTYNGRLNGNRYSGLTQINGSNVKNLALKWIFPIPHFGLETTPIVVDGVMYVTGPNQVYAVDALTGRQI